MREEERQQGEDEGEKCWAVRVNEKVIGRGGERMRRQRQVEERKKRRVRTRAGEQMAR